MRDDGDLALQVTGIKEALFWVLLGGAFLLMVHNAALYYYTRNVVPTKPAIDVPNGSRLAGFKLTDPEGNEFAIPSEGTYLISFLTTDCDACHIQVRHLNHAAGTKSYQMVFAVFGEDTERVARFMNDLRPEFPCFVDHERRLTNSLKLKSLPQTVELKDGVVVRAWVGMQESFQ